ncbi:MAG: peroxiredoxin [Pyrinomonadaceae bacterium]|nr:peroxiredoxin [Pyrinomonadaceae bacterium]
MPLTFEGQHIDDEAAVRVGALAPDFTLHDEQGAQWRLADKRGRVVALLFYPGDETLVCTRQLCSVRDHWTEYVETGAEIIGVSRDTSDSHRRFAERRRLPLKLLSDPDGSVIATYRNHSLLPSWATRAVTVIDAKGIVRFHKVMLKLFRPRDQEVVTAIYLSRYDVLTEGLPDSI